MLTSENSSSTFVSKKSSLVCGETRKLHDLFLETLDVLLSCFVVAPCVVSYWRGTWELIGVLVLPSNVLLSALSSFLIGGIGHLVFTLSQCFFKSRIGPDQHRLTYYVFSRCYTAIFGVVCVNMWRGSWIVCDWLTSADSLIIIYIFTFIALSFLIATRTVRSLGAVPYTITMDHQLDYFRVDTMFKTPGFHQPGLFMLDALFSVFVIGTLVVIAWRGLWGIMDLSLYPKDRTTSSWCSLVMGYITVILTFTIRPIFRCTVRAVENDILKLVICDVFYFMVFFGAVNVWRGIWNLLDVYLYPDNKILSYWITHVIPFLILAAIKCSNSVLVRGVFIDAESDESGDCISIPIHYVKLHFERERSTTNYIFKNTYIEHNFKHNLNCNNVLKTSKNTNEKDAESILLPKDLTSKEHRMQMKMDAGQIV